MSNATQQNASKAGTPSPERLGSADAFREWRGKCPTGGYGYDLLSWYHEDVAMRKCWIAAVEWAMQNTRA